MANVANVMANAANVANVANVVPNANLNYSNIIQSALAKKSIP